MNGNLSTNLHFGGFLFSYIEVPMERVVIHKERSAGWYRLSAYYLAKMTSELPLILVQPGIFVAVSYWCIGFNGVGPFFGTVFIMMVNAIAGQVSALQTQMYYPNT